MGPIGCLPRIIARFGKNASRLDQLQCVDSHNQAAKIFNSQLHSLCAEFQQQFPEAKVTYVDIYTIKSNLIANYSQYGNSSFILPHYIYYIYPFNTLSLPSIYVYHDQSRSNKKLVKCNLTRVYLLNTCMYVFMCMYMVKAKLLDQLSCVAL